MDFLVYGLPIILAFSFIYSNFIIKKAEKKLDFEFVNKLQVIKEKERKKIFLFLFFPIFYSSFNTILDKFKIEFYFIIAFIFLFIFIILFMSYKKYNNFKNQNFPDDFLKEIIKSETIKLIGIVSVFVFIFISF